MAETLGDIGVQGHDVPALLGRWARLGLVSPQQVEAILRAEGLPPALPAAVPAPRPAPPPERAAGGRTRLGVEALGYLGGVLGLAATLLLVQVVWSDLSSGARLALPLVASALLLVAGALVPGGLPDEDGTDRLRTALWLLSVGTWCGAFAVLGDQILDAEPRDTWLLVGLAGVALALPLYMRTHATAQQAALLLTAAASAGALGARAEWDEPTLIGLGAWLVAVTWFALGERRLLTPWLAARYLGAAGSVVTVLVMAGSVGGHVLAVVTVAGLFVWGVRADSIGLLAVASVGTLQAVPSIVAFYVPDNEGVAIPLALLAIGGTLVTVAVTLTRRRAGRRTSEEHPSPPRQ